MDLLEAENLRGLGLGAAEASVWADVEEKQLAREAEKLFNQLSRAYNTESVLDTLFKAADEGNKEVLDPLGRGAVDLVAMALVR